MTHVFAPKISYIELGREVKTTPWDYLDNWQMGDRGQHTIQYFEDKMKERWPGNYRIVVREFRVGDSMYRSSKWVMKFADPAEETLFNLRWA